MPVSHQTLWVHEEKKWKMLSVIVLLPSGVRSGDFALHLAEDGSFLQVSIMWPEPMIDAEVLLKKKLDEGQIVKYHPRILGFTESLRWYRQHKEDPVKSSAKISLIARVHHIVDSSRLAWRSSTALIVLVDMKLFVGNYDVTADDGEFEVAQD